MIRETFARLDAHREDIDAPQVTATYLMPHGLVTLICDEHSWRIATPHGVVTLNRDEHVPAPEPQPVGA